MKQLTLQFEGYAGSWQPENVNATKERKESEVKALVVHALRTVSTKYANCKSVAVGLVANEKVATAIAGTGMTAFCFALMYLAALLQG